jgi:hypothetical protein
MKTFIKFKHAHFWYNKLLSRKRQGLQLPGLVELKLYDVTAWRIFKGPDVKTLTCLRCISTKPLASLLFDISSKREYYQKGSGCKLVYLTHVFI